MNFIPEMEHKLAFEWLSDPLLEYALYLSCFLLLSILFFITVIIRKHQFKQYEIEYQEKIKVLFDQVISLNDNEADDSEAINKINKLIKNKPHEFIFAWSLLLESFEKSGQNKYLKVFLKLNYLDLLERTINSKSIKQQCLSIQTIGICKLKAFSSQLIKLNDDPSLSAYTCIALSRIQGISAINVVINAFEKKLITTTQLLSALLQIPKKQLDNWHKKKLNSDINSIIFQYLENF